MQDKRDMVQHFFNALYSITAIVGCLALGKVIASFAAILPASLYGMILFTLALHTQLLNAEKIKATVAWALRHMGVCFVPAGVGIINHFELIKQHGLAIVTIIFVTTFALLTLVGVFFQRQVNLEVNGPPSTSKRIK
jgi:holin-like protein